MPDPSPGYERALAAEPHLRAAVATVKTALRELARPGDTMCHGCAWDDIIKPLVSPFLGWERGFPTPAAKDPAPVTDDPVTWPLIPGSEFLGEYEDALKNRTPAATDTETWLRTSEAWDSFTRVLLDRLAAADPGEGHGICRKRTPKGSKPALRVSKCPACQEPATYSSQLDRYFHNDGSDNLPCWLAISRGTPRHHTEEAL